MILSHAFIVPVSVPQLPSSNTALDYVTKKSHMEHFIRTDFCRVSKYRSSVAGRLWRRRHWIWLQWVSRIPDAEETDRVAAQSWIVGLCYAALRQAYQC